MLLTVRLVNQTIFLTTQKPAYVRMTTRILKEIALRVHLISSLMALIVRTAQITVLHALD